jgi:hypothetical protein
MLLSKAVFRTAGNGMLQLRERDQDFTIPPKAFIDAAFRRPYNPANLLKERTDAPLQGFSYLPKK